MPEDLNNYSRGLSEESNVPLYFQLITLIKRQIRTGILKPGDLIPSESQLCSQYGVSRSTVRQALNQLAEERLIIRRRGKGSFIASEKLSRNLNHLYNFTEDMLSMGLAPHSEVLEQTKLDAPYDIIRALGITAEKLEVFKLTRVRYANGEPVLLETTYIPLYLCPGITNEDFASKSLYEVLRTKYSMDLFRAVETYEAVKLNRETSKLLKCKPSVAAFSIQRTAYLETGIAYEFTTSVVRSDKCLFRVELYANKSRVNFSRQISV